VCGLRVLDQAKRPHGSKPPHGRLSVLLDWPPGYTTWLFNLDINIPAMEGIRMGGLDKNNGCKLKQNKTTIKQIWGVNLLFIT
jgi:hypothetical protein